MTFRRFRTLDDGLGGGSLYANSSSWGAFRPGSRAENLHRERQGINRRYHNIYLESEGFNDKTKAATSGQAKATSQGQTGTRSIERQRHSSQHSGRVPVRIDGGEWEESGGSSSQRRQYYEDDGEDYLVPMESARMDGASERLVRQGGYSDRQNSAYTSSQGGGGGGGDPWQAVRVVRYSDGGGPGGGGGGFGGSGGVVNGVRETRLHSVRETRQPHPHPRDDLYYPPERPKWRGEGRWEERFDGDDGQVESFRDGRQRSTTIYESSQPASFQVDDGSWQSRSDNHLMSSDWNNNSNNLSGVHRGRSFADGSGRFRATDSWDTGRTTPGEVFNYSTTTRNTSNTHRTPGSEWQTRSDQRSSRRPSRRSTTQVYRQDLPGSSWQDTTSANQFGGPRSSSYYNDSSATFRPRTKSMDRMGDTTDGLRRMSISGGTRTSAKEDKEFLGKVQKELENQRMNWQPEIDRLLNSTIVAPDDFQQMTSGRITPFEAGKNSYVDTSSSIPVFKAYVDIKDFSPDSVSINFDRYTNKVIVEASDSDANGTIGQTFTQKIPLPRYADDTRLVARVNNAGVLRIEVPLVYYFPEDSSAARADSKAKAFIYEARQSPADGSNMVEVVVRPGSDFSVHDLQTEVADGKLVISGRKGQQRRVIQSYILPPNAYVCGIKERVGSDGCLTVRIPVT